jgi:hypothetical protein
LRTALASFSTAQPPNTPGRPEAGTTEPVHVYRAHDLTGLPIIVALDTADPDHLRWSALAVLDDSDTVLDTEAHKDRWRAWLYWTNLTQFLSLGGGDGVQLAASHAADFDVEVLAVCGGLGELETISGVRTPAAASPAGKPPAPAADSAGTSHRDTAWDEEILPILREEPDEAHDLLRLGELLADHGKCTPVFGYELGASHWLADFGWDQPDGKIAVVRDSQPADDEAARRDKAYTDAGWTIRTAADWLARLDELIAQLPDTEGPTR